MKQHKKKKRKENVIFTVYTVICLLKNQIKKMILMWQSLCVILYIEFQCLSFPSIYFRVNERKIETYYSLHGVKFVIIRCTMDWGVPYGVNLDVLPP